MTNEIEGTVIPNEADEMLIDPADLVESDEEEDGLVMEEDTSNSSDETEVSTPAEKVEVEPDLTPLLERLSKDIKYMDQDIQIKDYDDVKTTYQKGLDYDRKTEKLNELNTRYSYFEEKAKENGMSVEQYTEALKGYEKEQSKAQEQAELQDMIDNGISESIARKVVETNRIAKELNAEKLQIAEDKKALELAKQKEQETDKFLTAFPSVDIKSIPNEVFKDSESMGLVSAYTKYENAKLKQELDLLKQNKQNKDSSPVKGTTEHGGVVIEAKDDFLIGLGID